MILKIIEKFCLIVIIVSASTAFSQSRKEPLNKKKVFVDYAWAKNSVNAVAYRHNALTSYKNIQYIAFYDSLQRVVLGKRKSGSENWTLSVTQYRGKATDAHNSISIAVDGSGYLHLSWDHHANALRYCRSIAPGSLKMSDKMSMTGLNENKVTYPEFYSLSSGDLLFLYRDGSSGNGQMIMNRYNVKTKAWVQVQNGWINGEGERNAYCQTTIDNKGVIHIAWVWRETSNVATNHDVCYARSRDNGLTWEKSTGEKYKLPITAESAEYVYKIPQKSELINPPFIATDKSGLPYIAIYWRESNALPQYHLLYHNASTWVKQQISDRKTSFSLSGGGTKEVPISRPCLLIKDKNGNKQVLLIFRDKERGSKASVAVCNDLSAGIWDVKDLSDDRLGQWEPNYDPDLWKKKNILNLFFLNVEQGDGEKIKDIKAQPLSVLEWKP